MANSTPRATDSPTRVACFFFPNGVALPPKDGEFHFDWHWFPKGTGYDYQLNQSTASFERHRDNITFISGISHPRHFFQLGVLAFGKLMFGWCPGSPLL